MKQYLTDRLCVPLSQMDHESDDALWSYIIAEREECLAEIRRLVKSRNRWADKYNNLLKSVMK